LQGFKGLWLSFEETIALGRLLVPPRVKIRGVTLRDDSMTLQRLWMSPTSWWKVMWKYYC